ncbi:MAG: hypothetical protein JWQ14_596 [Adhaeribacter sp.]|nr:hypothetical protein [Adhaeribacter sp.]
MASKIIIAHITEMANDTDWIDWLLKKAGLDFEKLLVASANEFTAALQNQSPDIILFDQAVSSFSATEALATLQEGCYQIPIILIARAEMEETAAALVEKEVDDYILKEWPGRLPIAIRNTLAKYRLKQEQQVILDELNKNERKFKSLIENGIDMVLIIDLHYKPIYISPAFKSVLGYTAGLIQDLDLLQILHPQDRQVVLQKMAQSLNQPGHLIKIQEVRIKHQAGNWCWIDLTLTNWLADPAIQGIVHNLWDVTDRVLSELAKKDSEEKFRSFFENSIDGILLTEKDGAMLAANPAACRIFRMTEEEIFQIGRLGLIDDLDPRLGAGLKQRKTTGKTYADVTLLRKDGSKFPGEVTSSVFKDTWGNERTSIIIRDITERKTAEEKLKSSEEQYKLLFQYSPLPCWIYDLETLQILDVNETAIKHYNYSREEYLGMTVLDMRPAEEIKQFANCINNSKTENEIIRYGTFNHLKKNGTQIKVEVTGYRLNYQARNCMIVICNDITEKENALLNLKEYEAKLLTAQQLAKLGYWEFRFEDQSFYWTDEVFRIWGRDKETFKITSETFYDSVHPDDQEALRNEQTACRAGEIELDIEYRIILPDNSFKWVHNKGVLVKDHNGLPIAIEGTVQDITDRKIVEERLARSEARHRGILQSQTSYIIRTDLQGRYTYFNDKYLNDFGWLYTNRDILGNDPMISIKEYHRQRTIDAIAACLEHPAKVVQVEMDKLTKNGGVRNTLWDYICITDNNGNPTEFQCIGVDISDRVKAEKSLVESNTRYEYVSKATSDAIYDWNIITGQIFWGEGFYALFGYKSEELTFIINSWLDYVHPDDLARVKASLDATIIGSENKWQYEYRFLKADSSYAYVVERGFVIRDENNKALRMVGAMQDITEKKKLEELLNKATKMARIGTYEADLINNTLYWSDMTKLILEVDSDYVPHLDTIFNFYKPGKSRELFIQAFKELMENGKSLDLELQVITRNGKECWVRAMGEVETINNVCTKLYGSFQDIDTRKITEIELLKAYEERENILESIGDAFLAVDKNWLVTYWNNTAAEILQRPREEALNKNFLEVYPDVVDTAVYTYFHKAVNENVAQHFESFYSPLNIWFDVSAYPSVNGLSVYFRDVTQRKLSEIRLQELNNSLQTYTNELVLSNKGLEQFSYIVSHNLRAPVANIIGVADLLNNIDYPEKVKEDLRTGLLDNVKRLDNVIKDLNTILQVKKEISKKKEPVNLAALVQNIQLSIQNLIEKEQVQIDTDFSAAGEFNTIKSYLQSIFYNLIINSIKYRQAHLPPVIQIKSEIVNGKFKIKFRDNGLGINLIKRKDQVFGLYKRFHQNIEGKGMGLFMVKTQVETLGGGISIASEINKGTEFLIEFEYPVKD